MTREEIKDELSNVLLNLGGLSFSDVYSLLEGDAAITFEGKDLINIAEHFYNLPRNGLWDSEKVASFIKYHAQEFVYISRHSGEAKINEFKLVEAMYKAMED